MSEKTLARMGSGKLKGAVATPYKVALVIYLVFSALVGIARKRAFFMRKRPEKILFSKKIEQNLTKKRIIRGFFECQEKR